MGSEPKYLPTRDFWDLMCDPAFVRTSKITGYLRGQMYWCLYAPEDVVGFIEERLAEARAPLKIRA